MVHELRLGPGTDEEHRIIARLVRAQSAPVRLVRRAQSIEQATAGLTVPAIAGAMPLSEKAVRHWLKRFAAEGLAGLYDAPRSGRPRTYAPEVTNQVIAKARSLPPKPPEGEGEIAPHAPTCHWTLDRRQAELAKEGSQIKRSQIKRSQIKRSQIKRSQIKRSQIRRLLKAEPMVWQQSRTWLESPDPDFAPHQVSCCRQRKPSAWRIS